MGWDGGFLWGEEAGRGFVFEGGRFIRWRYLFRSVRERGERAMMALLLIA